MNHFSQKLKPRALLWFTKDLRLHDNLLIHWATRNSEDVMALAFEPNGLSDLQREFYLQSAFELAKKFTEEGISFFILKGAPEVEIPRWVQCNSIDVILTQDHWNSRDRHSLNALENLMGADRIKTFFGQSLLDKTKLPFEISEMPLVFTQFRKRIEAVDCISTLVSSDLGSLTGFSTTKPEGSVFVAEASPLSRNVFPYELLPGESGALERVQEYFWKTQSLSQYKQTRNGMLIKNDSSKFSAGLGLGCVSMRMIFSEIRKFEERFGANESTQWFIYELLWRDYFKFLSLRIGPQLFSVNGMAKRTREWISDADVFATWCEGKTGADFIDANMNELNETGWMSNRGRQNVASFLAKTLKVDWTLGARYFENQLIDFDTESNWGNWLYAAGVGTDPRDRTFNFQWQAEQYDPDFSYRKKWLRHSK